MDPQQLYELWERQQWQSHTIDFTKDKEDWAALSDEDREQPRLEPVLVLRRREVSRRPACGPLRTVPPVLLVLVKSIVWDTQFCFSHSS